MADNTVHSELLTSAEWSARATKERSTAKAIWCLGIAAHHSRLAHKLAATPEASA